MYVTVGYDCPDNLLEVIPDRAELARVLVEETEHDSIEKVEIVSIG